MALWWWAILLAVIVFSAEFGVSGTTRLVLEIVAAVLFVFVVILLGAYAEARRRRDNR